MHSLQRCIIFVFFRVAQQNEIHFHAVSRQINAVYAEFLFSQAADFIAHLIIIVEIFLIHLHIVFHALDSGERIIIDVRAVDISRFRNADGIVVLILADGDDMVKEAEIEMMV